MLRIVTECQCAGLLCLAHCVAVTLVITFSIFSTFITAVLNLQRLVVFFLAGICLSLPRFTVDHVVSLCIQRHFVFPVKLVITVSFIAFVHIVVGVFLLLLRSSVVSRKVVFAVRCFSLRMANDVLDLRVVHLQVFLLHDCLRCLGTVLRFELTNRRGGGEGRFVEN